ncbi:hypothetical protein IEE94_10390 [Yimella sp. cx-573]|nr:hypothetical protein [Yimella sp. cx-573]
MSDEHHSAVGDRRSAWPDASWHNLFYDLAFVAGLHCDLATSDALRGKQVERLLVLDDPTRVIQLTIDQRTRPSLGSEPSVVP